MKAVAARLEPSAPRPCGVCTSWLSVVPSDSSICAHAPARMRPLGQEQRWGVCGVPCRVVRGACERPSPALGTTAPAAPAAPHRGAAPGLTTLVTPGCESVPHQQQREGAVAHEPGHVQRELQPHHLAREPGPLERDHRLRRSTQAIGLRVDIGLRLARPTLTALERMCARCRTRGQCVRTPAAAAASVPCGQHPLSAHPRQLASLGAGPVGTPLDSRRPPRSPRLPAPARQEAQTWSPARRPPGAAEAAA